MEDYLQLKTIDNRNEGICQKQVNIYQKSWRKIDFQAISYTIVVII